MHGTRQLLTRDGVKGGCADDLIEQDGTADDGIDQRQGRGGQHAEQDDRYVLFEHREVAHETPHDTLLVDAMLAHAALGITVHPPAFGAGPLKLVEDGVVVGNLLSSLQALPQAHKGQQLQLDTVGAVAQHHGGAADAVALFDLAEFLVGHIALLGGRIVLTVQMHLQTVGGGVVVDVGLGHAGQGEYFHLVSLHAVDVAILAGVDQPDLTVVSVHVIIQFQAHVGGGGVNAVSLQHVGRFFGQGFQR